MSTVKPNKFDFIIGKPPLKTNKDINPVTENEKLAIPELATAIGNDVPPENAAMQAEQTTLAANKPVQEVNLTPSPENKSVDNRIPPPPIFKLPEVPLMNTNNIRPGQIITSEQLVKMKFDTLTFHDKWNTLFGNPAANAYIIIFAVAGEGKSTLAIQFAKYLSENHGKTLFISGEEGISKTLMDKFINTNSISASLHVVELKSSVEIFRVVQPGTYRFIFLDSLQHLNITAGKMRELREKYKTTAFVSISQSTKGGLIRGSAEHAHDADIVVEIEKGLATTTKNRFKEKGTTFNVFEVITEPESPPDSGVATAE